MNHRQALDRLAHGFDHAFLPEDKDCVTVRVRAYHYQDVPRWFIEEAESWEEVRDAVLDGKWGWYEVSIIPSSEPSPTWQEVRERCKQRLREEVSQE